MSPFLLVKYTRPVPGSTFFIGSYFEAASLSSALYLIFLPSFVEITVDGESKTGMKITIQEEK